MTMKKHITTITYGGIFNGWAYALNAPDDFYTRTPEISNLMNEEGFSSTLKQLKDLGYVLSEPKFNLRMGVDVEVYKNVISIDDIAAELSASFDSDDYMGEEVLCAVCFVLGKAKPNTTKTTDKEDWLAAIKMIREFVVE